MLSRIIFLSVLSTLCDGAYFNTRSLSANTQIALNNFLLDQYDFGVIKTEVGGNSYGFSRTGIIALQEFLQAKGRLPINSVFNSLVIGTLQTYLYDLNFYPDEKPCGVFGPDTRRGLQQFLQKQRFYRYTQHKITANSNFDSKSVKLLQEFLSQPRSDGNAPYFRGRIDGRWKTETIREYIKASLALRTFLHNKGARVGFTRDFNKTYNFRKGLWGYKTSIVLQQYLVDQGYYLARVDGRFTSKSIFALNRYLNNYRNKVAASSGSH